MKLRKNKFIDIGFDKKFNEIKRLEEDAKKNFPHSSDLEDFGLKSSVAKENFLEKIDLSISDSIEGFFQNTEVFFEITGDVRESIKKNIDSIFKSGLESEKIISDENIANKIFSSINDVLDSNFFKDSFNEMSSLDERKEELEDKNNNLNDLFKSTEDDFYKKGYYEDYEKNKEKISEIDNEKLVLFKSIIKEIEKNEDVKEIFIKSFLKDKYISKELDEIEDIYSDILNNKKLILNLFGKIKGWEKVGSYFNFNNIKSWGILIIGLIFARISVSDIYAYGVLKGCFKDIANGYTEQYNMVKDSLLNGNLELLYGLTPAMLDITFILITLLYISNSFSTVASKPLKNTLKIGSAGAIAAGAVYCASLTYGIAGATSSMSEEMRLKSIINWYENNSSSEVVKNEDKIDSKKVQLDANDNQSGVVGNIITDGIVKIAGITVSLPNFKNTIEDSVVTKGLEYGDVFGEARSVVNKGGKIIENFDLESESKKLVDKLRSGDLDKTGGIGIIQGYKEKIREAVDLKDIYLEMIKHVSLDMNGKGSNGIPLYGPSSNEKIILILRMSGFKGLNSFIESIYSLKEQKKFLEEIKKKMKRKNGDNFKPGNHKPLKSGGMEMIKNNFISKYDKTLDSYTDSFTKIINESYNDKKIKLNNKEFDNLVDEFNNEIKNLSRDYDEYKKGINLLIRVFNSKIKEIEDRYKAQGYKGDPEKVNQLELVLGDELKKLPEKNISPEDVLRELKGGIKHYHDTGEIKESLLKGVENMNTSLLRNGIDKFGNIILLLLSVGFGYKVINGRKVGYKEMMKMRGKEFENYSKELVSCIERVTEIMEEKIGKIKSKKISSKKISDFRKITDKYKIYLDKGVNGGKKGNNSNKFKLIKENNLKNFDKDNLNEKIISLDSITAISQDEKYGKNDTVFLSEFLSVDILEGILIKEEEDGGFRLELLNKSMRGNKDLNFLDFKSPEFNNLLKESSKIKNEVLGGMNKYRIGIIINKDGFLTLPYGEDGEFEIQI